MQSIFFSKLSHRFIKTCASAFSWRFLFDGRIHLISISKNPLSFLLLCFAEHEGQLLLVFEVRFGWFYWSCRIKVIISSPKQNVASRSLSLMCCLVRPAIEISENVLKWNVDLLTQEASFWSCIYRNILGEPVTLTLLLVKNVVAQLWYQFHFAWKRRPRMYGLPFNRAKSITNWTGMKNSLLESKSNFHDIFIQASVASLFCLYFGKRFHTPPGNLKYPKISGYYGLLMNLVWIAMLVVYVLEIGYKFKTLQVEFTYKNGFN